MHALRATGISVVLALSFVIAPTRASSAVQSGAPRCIFAKRVAVALAEGAPTSQEVWAQLCMPKNGQATVVQVLISGLTLGSTYWDFPYQPNRYSYVRALTAGGIATLNYDRVGIGR